MSGPLEPVTFDMPGDSILKPKWQVTLQEDGSLHVIPIGRRSGRVLVSPVAHNCVVITTDRITRGED